MNRSKALLVAGLAAIAVLAYIFLRGGARDPVPPSGASGSATASAAPAPGSAASAAPDRMQTVRPPIHVAPGGVDHDLAPVPGAPEPDAAPHPSRENGFDAEPRDASFADAHEREIDRRVAALKAPDGVKVAPTECRVDQCRITFTASDDRALGRFVGQLESSDGLGGYAQMMVLEAITDTSDGNRQERVYARFGE